jgi:hypothetical protein
MRKRLPAYENVKTAGRPTKIRSPACRKSLVLIAPGGALLAGVTVLLRRVVVVPVVVVVLGGVGLPVLFGGAIRRWPSRITTTCAGILGIGMWVAQAAITSYECQAA